MIKSFSCKKTAELNENHRSRHFDSRIVKRALVKLDQLHAALELDDLRIPPSNRLEKLASDSGTLYSVRVNKQWRLCFEWISGHAHGVIICDYH